jgi:hypothetical protein
LTDFVSTAIPRKAVEDSYLPTVEIARRMGWLRTKKGRTQHYVSGDCARLRRTVGISRDFGRTTPQGAHRKATRYATAVAIVKAAGFDPIDYDL